jgi:hypothetical protein
VSNVESIFLEDLSQVECFSLIAMLHVEVAALNDGIKGKWEFLESAQVARFKVG